MNWGESKADLAALATQIWAQCRLCAQLHLALLGWFFFFCFCFVPSLPFIGLVSNGGYVQSSAHGERGAVEEVPGTQSYHRDEGVEVRWRRFGGPGTWWYLRHCPQGVPQQQQRRCFLPVRGGGRHCRGREFLASWNLHQLRRFFRSVNTLPPPSPEFFFALVCSSRL